MSLSLFCTQARTVKPVVRHTDHFAIYCCGPTVYRDAHIGNLRTFLLTDLVVRTLKALGEKVLVVQNITDVGHMSEDFEDDKLLAQGKIEKRTALEIARDYESRFHRDIAAMNITPAHHYPRASEFADHMFTMISSLIDLGHAYVGSDNTVYYDAQSFTSYGAISGNTLTKLKPGHRYDYVDDGAKKFHADWALWKSSPNRRELVWQSPWGIGFPGWHIECSAMSLHYLNHVDLHIGGIDLRFPHHENERAQSNPIASSLARDKSDDCTSEAVSHWLHGEHLLFEGRKMSKSAGNVVLISTIVDRGFDPLALRLCFLENRYRSQMDLSWDSIAAAHHLLTKWRALSPSEVNESEEVRSLYAKILAAFCDDLNTPKAMQILRNALKSSLHVTEKRALLELVEPLVGLDLLRQPPVHHLSPELAELLRQRALAREAKDFALSDQLRNTLSERGIEIHDGPAGQSWNWKS